MERMGIRVIRSDMGLLLDTGNVFPPRVSVPDMHHGTCVMHVPWCMPGSLTSGYLWSRWRGKRSRHSQSMRNLQFYVSGKRPISESVHIYSVILARSWVCVGYVEHVWNGPLLTIDTGRDMKAFAAKTKSEENHRYLAVSYHIWLKEYDC